MVRFRPAIVAKQNSLTPEFCQSLIDEFDLKLRPATVGKGLDTDIRSANTWVVKKRDDKDLVEAFERIFFEENEKHWKFDLQQLGEIQIIRYDSGGHYDWHLDVGSGANISRKLSLVVPLNDPEEWEGGELLVKAGPEEVSMPLEKGVPILFPSFILHKATQVDSGVRYIVAAFCSGPMFK